MTPLSGVSRGGARHDKTATHSILVHRPIGIERHSIAHIDIQASNSTMDCSAERHAECGNRRRGLRPSEN